MSKNMFRGGCTDFFLSNNKLDRFCIFTMCCFCSLASGFSIKQLVSAKWYHTICQYCIFAWITTDIWYQYHMTASLSQTSLRQHSKKNCKHVLRDTIINHKIKVRIKYNKIGKILLKTIYLSCCSCDEGCFGTFWRPMELCMSSKW